MTGYYARVCLGWIVLVGGTGTSALYDMATSGAHLGACFLMTAASIAVGLFVIRNGR